MLNLFPSLFPYVILSSSSSLAKRGLYCCIVCRRAFCNADCIRTWCYISTEHNSLWLFSILTLPARYYPTISCSVDIWDTLIFVCKLSPTSSSLYPFKFVLKFPNILIQSFLFEFSAVYDYTLFHQLPAFKFLSHLHLLSTNMCKKILV